MSFEAMAMVVTVEDISPINKLVLILLSNYADENSKCFPSYEKIAKLANCSRRTAVRSINTLNKLGLISIERRKLSAIYQFATAMPMLFVPATHHDKGNSKRRKRSMSID